MRTAPIAKVNPPPFSPSEVEGPTGPADRRAFDFAQADRFWNCKSIQVASALLSALTLLSGCAVGNIRHHEMGALAGVPLQRLHVAAPEKAELSAERKVRQQGAVAAALQAKGFPSDTNGEGLKVMVVSEVLQAREAKEAPTVASGAMSAAASFLGVSGHQDDASAVTLKLTLFEKGSHDPLGEVLWQGAEVGPLDRVLDHASKEAAEVLAEDLESHRDLFAPRRAADERFLFTPSAFLLEPGEVVVSNDEVLLFHLGVGLSKWVQLNVSAGGLPIPGAGAVPFAGGGGVAAAGGAGVILLGAFDVGLKVKLLDESKYVPALALSYDMVDLFGAALGAGGVAVLGNGVAAAAGGAAAGVNVQLNVFSLALNKHLLPWLQVGGGLGVVDNHHFLPQSAGFVVATSVGGTAGSTTVSVMPTAVLPFVNAEVAVTRWFSVIQEVFPGKDTVGLTGLRFVVGGGDGTLGPLALSKLRLKLDLAAIETNQRSTDHTGWIALPWLGLGLYAL